ncbi:MAG: GNAT family N-acetyltransferase [Clostridiales bacterium]|nr:GNAT family N-acetyltransferase [Clostridiales bacterium]
MITVKEIVSGAQKEAITIHIMGSLIEWFSPAEDIPVKAKQHREMPFFAVFDGEECIGFAALKPHNRHTAEIYNLGVLKAFHQQGAGRLLVNACVQYCLKRSMTFLTVKTLDESADYEPYQRTRTFYRKEGFLPLEVMPTYWNEENPCLFLAKVVDRLTDGHKQRG